MKRCPKCGGKRFVVTQHVTQEWVVDGNGDFIDELSSCVDVIHRADDDDIWECYECAYNDAGRAFNVKEDK